MVIIVNTAFLLNVKGVKAKIQAVLTLIYLIIKSALMLFAVKVKILMAVGNAIKYLIAISDFSVLDIALDTSFKTNEGYSKAFYKNFGKLPSEYQKGNCFIPLSIYYSIKRYYYHISNKENVSMNPNYCLITPVHREKSLSLCIRKRQLIIFLFVKKSAVIGKVC